VELGEKDLEAIQSYSDELKARGEAKRYVAPPFGVDMGFPDKW
jgi:glycerol 2-dehydrogenase (NADP+)